ncbi:MAG: Ig-like domain-containing protein [Polyangiales bacterium]
MNLRSRSLLGSLSLAALLVPSLASAQAGREGMRTISATNAVINRYTTLATAASAGASTITLSSASALASAEFAMMALSPGDLLLIYQAQGATIDATNTAAYGSVTALNGAGRWEFVRVGAVSSNTITLDAREHPTGLVRSYGPLAQVVRVPQYARLQVSASGSVIAQPWNGTTGGIVALASNSSLTVVGAVRADAAGFRGGAVDNNSNAPGSNTAIFRSADSNDGAEKGESIAGGAAAYDAMNGRFGRGAPANGGGGGNAHNGGGGGGANGGATAGYNGAGVMLGTVVGAAAWQLDPAFMLNGNALTTGPGGGRGGYTYSANNGNALTTAPGNVAWGGDNRLEAGGRGGRALGLAVDRLFFGGGGGAGDGNNGVSGAGGVGGGLVFLVARAIDGNGTVSANGANGVSVGAAGNDAPGGGGAGGTIVLSSIAPITSALIVTANGGDGGVQTIAGNEAEGPGGGGGGGVVHVPAMSTVTAAVVGGNAGTTTSAALTEFPVNGATLGAAGSTSATLTPCAMFAGICPLDTTTFVTVASPMTGASINTRAPTITGTTEPNATVTVSVNGSMVTVTADAMGNWSATVPMGAVSMDGAVTINVTATDGSMNTANTAVMLTVDTVAPTLAISAPMAMALLNTGAPTIRGTAEANSTVTLTFTGGRMATATTDAMGNWSYTVPAAMPLSDGPVTVTAVAADRAGNTSPSRSVSFTVDTVTTVAISTPMTGATVGNRAPMIAGTAEPNATVTVTINAMSVMVTADAMGNWSAATPMGAITMDGMVTINVSSRDAAGNTANATSTITVDTRVVVAISAPAMGATINSTTPTITGTARPNATITLDFGGGRTAMVTADAMGNWSYTVPAAMPLMDGATVMLSASAMGPSGVVTVSVTFTVDASTTVSITSPMSGAMVMETRPEIRGTGEPGATITLVFDSGERGTVTVDAMGNWSFTPTTSLSAGPHRVEVTARDRAGNTATQSQSFVVVGSGQDAGADASGDSGATGDSGADAGSDATVDARADGSVVADAQVMDGAGVDGSSADSGPVRGTLEGSGACNCAVISAPASGRGANVSWAIAVACVVATTCARRARRRR